MACLCYLMHRNDALAIAHPSSATTVGDGLEYAFGAPTAAGRLRASCADFEVSELLGFEPDGDGEHVLLHIEKEGITTADLVAIVASAADVSPRQIGYCGMKDRRAVARQWVSVPMAGRADWDWTPDSGAPLKVLARARHGRKLRPGSHRANAFKLRISEITGGRAELDDRLCRIAREGVPNYFGPQRFGRSGGNIARADAMLAKALRPRNHHIQSVYLSALRAWLFNAVASARVARGSWNRLLRGDCVMLDGTRSVFGIDDVTAELADRAVVGDIHPTGPLWGTGAVMVKATARAVEEVVLARYEARCAGLARFGLKAARRALRMRVRKLAWNWEPDGSLSLSFTLDRGQYATSVVRECCACDS